MRINKLPILMLVSVLASAGCASLGSASAPAPFECPKPPPAPPLALMPYPNLQGMLDALIQPYDLGLPKPAPSPAPAKPP